MSHRTQEIRFCRSRDGVRIAYAVRGTGPSLVCISHWMHTLKFDLDSPVWNPWLSTLTRRHSVISYDWRGCGLSDWDRIDLSFERHVEDLEAVVAAAGVKRFVLVAMAFGAGTGLAYAARHPELVSHLVLYGSWSRGRLARMTTAEERAEARTRLKAIELGWPDENSGYGQFYTSLYLPNASSEQRQSLSHELHASTSQQNAIGIIKAFYKTDLRKIAPQIRCPTLVFHAHEESLIPFNEGRAVAALIPGARFVPINSRNHLVLSTEPAWQKVGDELDSFLPGTFEVQTESVELNLEQLTPRERQILDIVAQGIGNNGIAKQLGISEKTVRNHISTILDKLGVDGRLQAVVRAREAGLGRKSRS